MDCFYYLRRMCRHDLGSDFDKASLELDFELFNGNFSGISTFIGEWQVSPAYTETATRWKYYDFFARTCRKYGYSLIMGIMELINLIVALVYETMMLQSTSPSMP